MKETPHILVIDDEQVIIDGVRKACSLENYSLDVALTVTAATEKISKNYYSIILCDIMMPDGDGFQVLNEIQIRNIDSAFIMMTGYSTFENAVTSLYRGAFDFIPKPFTVDELLSSMYRANRYLQIKEGQRHSAEENQRVELFYVECPSKYFRLGHSSWLFEETDGSVLVGVCDLFLATIDSIAGLDLLEPEDEIGQGISCLTIKSGDERTHKVHSPISGRIIDVNKNLKSACSLIEKDPYFEGWVYRVIPNDLGYEFKNLIPCSSDGMRLRSS
jgi:CheY-like chemotaxis protein/glycine cleavage system H lipoate-binding protein